MLSGSIATPRPLDTLIEAQLPAAASGDSAAYGRIVAACQNSVTAIALAIVRDVPASEDIAQEAFISAWQNLKRLQNPSSFLPWLRQITRNLARDHLRARGRSPRTIQDADAAIEMAADPDPCPAQRVLDEERNAVAAELISALPEDSRETLLLYYREGQSSRQVAVLLGLSDEAVRKRLSRARASVRAALLERFGEFARGSAPSTAFASIVTTAVALASPPAAASGILTAAAATAGAKTFGQVLLGAAGSIGFALIGGFAGIWLGLRNQLKGAIDKAERLALVRSAVVSALASIAFVVALVFISRYDDGWEWPLLATLAFMGVVFYQALVVQPRVLARRHALEAERDPVAAAARRRKERWTCRIGTAVGLIAGFGGLLAGLVSAGRL